VLEGKHPLLPRDKCPCCDKEKFVELKTCGSGSCAGKFTYLKK
jgi:hypothetical protein